MILRGLLALLLALSRLPAADAQIVFSVRSWTGDYATGDIPGGVSLSAHTDAIYHLDLSDPGGGRLREIVPGIKDPYAPSLSADGRWVYFQSTNGGACQIYRCRADGTDTTCLTGTLPFGTQAYGCTLHRGGGQVVFVTNDGQVGRVALMDADGGHARIVAPQLGYHYMASLSPDGKRIVFSHTADGYRLKLMNLDGTRLVNLTPDAPESFCGQFAGRGDWLVFTRRDGEIYRVRDTGRNFQKLTTGNDHYVFALTRNDKHASSDNPDVSPDGTLIAHCGKVGDVSQVFVMNLNGTDRRQLTNLRGACGRVKWSADGKTLAFASFVDDKPQLFVMPAGGGTPQRLTQFDGAVHFLNWQGR
jgi:Tol biopolymer transport system component